MLDDLIPAPSDQASASTPPVVEPPPLSPTPPQIKVPPPQGDEQKASSYISQLISLIKADELVVFHTDLNKYSIDSIQDHYFAQLSDYEIEVSHSKSPDTDKDFYIILFNNVKQIKEGCSEKVILAYIHLTAAQFNDFKSAADEQIEKKRKEAEVKRFNEAMDPIDNLLENLASGSGSVSEEGVKEEVTQLAEEPEKPEKPEEPEKKADELIQISGEPRLTPTIEEVVLSPDSQQTPSPATTA